MYMCDRACKNQPCECKIIAKFLSLFYCNLRTISLLQNLMGNLRKWDGYYTFRAEDISESITQCNLHSHGWFCRPSHIMIWHTRYHGILKVPLITQRFSTISCHLQCYTMALWNLNILRMTCYHWRLRIVMIITYSNSQIRNSDTLVKNGIAIIWKWCFT